MTNGVPEPKPGALIKLQTPLTESPAVPSPKIRLSLPGSSDARAAESDYGFPRVPDTPSTSASAIKLVLNTATPHKEKKKKKNVPKAQSQGLSDQDFKTISLVLQKLLADKRSLFFRQPVDPVRDGAPDYLSIVANPMDLSTVRAKFDTGAYASRQDFEADIRLLISNCYLYNPHGSAVRKAGEVLEKYFNATWAKMENTLRSSLAAPKSESSSKAATPVPPPSTPMAPPPVPAAGAPVRIKLKQTKSVTIDDMPPPPIPSKKGSSKERTSDRAEKPKKKPMSDLDDLLGEEIDAMESDKKDDFDDLLGPSSPPPTKKIKFSTKPPAPSFPATASAPRPDSKPKDQGLKVKIPGSPTKATTSLKSKASSAERPPLERKKSDKSSKSSKSSKSPDKLRSTDKPRSFGESSHGGSRPPSGGPSRSLSPVKAAIPSFQPPPPVAATTASGTLGYAPQWPQPPSDLPDTVTNNMPFRQKRAKALIQILIKDPQAIYVSCVLSAVLTTVLAAR